MDDGGFTSLGPPMFGSMDFDFVDELFDVECWSPTSNVSDFLQPGPSTSLSLDETCSSLTYAPDQITNSYQEEKKIWSLLAENSSQNVSQEEHVADSQSQSQKQIIAAAKTSYKTLKFCWKSDELNRFLWIEPTVKDRLMSAISQLKEQNRNRDVLIQIWVPVKKGQKSFLTTVEQPYFFQPTSRRLLNYRDVSEKYEFLADENTKQALGLPGRVFIGKAPEWTPDVRFFRQDEYPRVRFAHQYDVRGSIALPVFETDSDDCLGVVEIIMTTEKFNYHPEVESVCKALETVQLRSSETSNSSQEQARKRSYEASRYEASRPEILTVLRTVSEKHNLPLAQTWASCSHQGKGGCWHTDRNIACVSTIDSACYVHDQRVLDFHKACSEHHLSRGQGGIVGKAFETNQPCFATDVTEFSKADYPLAHHAKMFGLRGAVAIRLSSIYHEMNDCVLEFYSPVDFQETGLCFHDKIWQSVSMVIQQTCHSLKLITVKDNKLQTLFSDRLAAENEKILEGSAVVKNHQETSSWFSHNMKPQRSSLNFGEEEPNKELNLSTNWTNTNDEQYSMSEGISGVSSEGRSPFGSIKAGKQRTNIQKTLSLQVLRQYFAGSLKDAAKNIGVCPTTLKRICRQHGIARWPSRKIKKVGHSLQKLQLVINSVQGAEGSIQLSSFYTNFPELNSPDTQLRGDHVPTVNLKDHSKQQPTTTTSTSASASTSSSHTSSSSGHHYPSREKISSTITAKASGSKGTSATYTEDIPGSLKRPRREAELQILAKKESEAEHPPFKSQPASSLPRSWPSRDTGVFKAKATFGEEKIRFTILPTMGFQDLQQEMAKRFDLTNWSKIVIKYLDDDKEWILLTCDADIEECIDMHRLSGSHIIKLSLSHYTSSPGISGFS